MNLPDSATVMSFVDPQRTGGIRTVPGEWCDEPDKATWVDPVTQLDCMAIRNHMGTWCGYVGVPDTHPWHGRHFSDVAGEVDVHGGLNFAGPCAADHNPTHICHVPLHGRPDNVWWLGFDCGHAFDLHPAYLVLRDTIPGFGEIYEKLAAHETYRTFGYVITETVLLAQQVVRHGG